MPLIPKPNYNQIFASQAPDIDKPSVFHNYPEGWGPESRPNNGKPTIKGFNYLQQTSDLKDLWILQNGACLPYDESIEYAEGAPVLKDGVIQYKTADGFKSRDSVTIPTYNSAADGIDLLTGVADGAYFNVRSEDGDTNAVEYQNIGGVPTPTGKSYPSSGFVNSLKTHNNLDGRDADEAHPASAILDKSGISQEQINDSIVYEVNTLADLKVIKPRKNKQVVFVQTLNTNFIYDSSLATSDNAVTIIKPTDSLHAGAWEMQTQDAYYASWFCAGNSPSAPKQEEFMVGYIYATSKKRPFIVDIPIYVNSTRKQSGFYNQVHYAVVAQSNSELHFMPEGKLIQIGVNEAAYSILSLYGADNFVIKNPKLEGDKYTKTGNAGESGFGLAITGCSNGIIEYPHVSKCRGDGIYLGQEYYNNNASNLIPKNIKIIKPTILDSYRNGLALCAGDDVYFDAPFIDAVEGTAPQACIDIEPEEGLTTRSYLKNVIVHNATLLRGKSSGVLQWIAGSRDVDVKFTGTTMISGCYAVLGCNGSAEDWSTVTCNGSITFEKIVFDQRITNNTEGYFDVSVPTRGKGIGIIIDTLEIHTQAPSVGYQIPFLFNGRYTHSGNFKINQMSITDHGSPTVINMVRTSAGSTNLEHIKIPIPDIRKIDHYDAVGTYSCGDYVDVGGYEERTVANINADALLANTQLFTPVDDGTGAVYTRVQTLPNIGRKLTYKLNDNAVSVGYGLQVTTPFLELARVECIDKGGYITIDNTQAQTQVSRIFRKWGLGGVYVNQ